MATMEFIQSLTRKYHVAMLGKKEWAVKMPLFTQFSVFMLLSPSIPGFTETVCVAGQDF